MLVLIKKVFLDVLKLYKSFGHFVVSKILIYLSIFAIMFIVAIPFLLLLFLIVKLFGFSFDIYWLFSHPFVLIFSLIFFLVFAVLEMLAYSYKAVLFSLLNLTYTKNKKLALKKNYYFDLKMFFNYSKLFFYNLLILLAPVLFFILGFFLLAFIYGGVNQAILVAQSGMGNSFSISLLVLLIISFIAFIYLSYRTLFSYIILVDESKGKKFKKAFYYIKKSFSLTKGFKKLLYFIVISLLLLVVSLPIYMPKDYFSTQLGKQSDYLAIKYGGVDRNIDFYQKQNLELEYGNLEELELRKRIAQTRIMLILFSLLDFLLIYGLFEMMLVSFYKRKLIKK